MARKARRSRKKSSRKRDSRGHFVKARETPRKRRSVRRTRRRAREVEEAPAPRRRRRHYARKNPWYGQPRRHAKAARKGHSRRRRHATRHRAAPRRTRARGRTRTKVVYKTVYRTRRATAKRRRSSRSLKRLRHPREVETEAGAHQYLAAEGYALENPLSAGELTFVVATAGLGWLVADFLGRYLNTTAVAVTAGTPSLVNGVPVGATMANDVATLVMPGYYSIGAQAGLALITGVGAHYAHSPMLKASLQGSMIGVGLHLFADIAKPLMANLFKNSALGQRLYLAEIEAREAGAQPAALTAGTTPANAALGTIANGATTVNTSTAAGGTFTLSGLPRDVGPVAHRGVGAVLLPPLRPQPSLYQPQAPGAVVGGTYTPQQAASQAAQAAQAAANGQGGGQRGGWGGQRGGWGGQPGQPGAPVTTGQPSGPVPVYQQPQAPGAVYGTTYPAPPGNQTGYTQWGGPCAPPPPNTIPRDRPCCDGDDAFAREKHDVDAMSRMGCAPGQAFPPPPAPPTSGQLTGLGFISPTALFPED